MKKSMLALITIGCLLPLTSSPICLKYVSGPDYSKWIHAEFDMTNIGSHLPTGWGATEPLYKGGKEVIWRGGTQTVFVTIKGERKYDSNMSKLITKELYDAMSYDITIDDKDQVTFTETGRCKNR